MPANPAHIVQTSVEAKRAYKQQGPCLSSRQQKQLARSAELEERAARFREREINSNIAKKKREEREKKEREARKQNGLGLATQLIGYSHTQAQLKNGMEAFLGFRKKTGDKKEELELKEEERRRVDEDVAKRIEAAVEEVAKEPWDEEDGDALELPYSCANKRDQWIEDDLDDDTLLEVHDSVMSDPVEDVGEPPAPVLAPIDVPTPESSKRARSKEDPEFKRIHGPVNHVLEAILDKLPEPLLELLSQDTTKDPALWTPAPALLHKLNPIGLPPHRLRVKVGCVVSLLRELNSSSQLSKSQHLQILRMEKDRLECLVLDGQLEGTKTFLTRTTFNACHRNDTRYPFQRFQFPIQVAKGFAPIQPPKEAPQATFKLPSISRKIPPRPTNASKKPSLPSTRPQPTKKRNPSFKLPGLPASKTKPTEPLISLLDGLDDFLESGTQIARELSLEPSSSAKALKSQTVSPTSKSKLSALPPLSIQDFDFSMEDLIDSPEAVANPKQPDLSAPSLQKPTRPSAITTKPLTPQSPKPSTNKYAIPPPLQQARPLINNSTMPPPLAQSLKRKAPSVPPDRPSPPLKRATTQLGRMVTSPSFISHLAQPSNSFSDFGLSTQEAVSFFDDDDDDLAFGSPVEIAV